MYCVIYFPTAVINATGKFQEEAVYFGLWFQSAESQET